MTKRRWKVVSEDMYSDPYRYEVSVHGVQTQSGVVRLVRSTSKVDGDWLVSVDAVLVDEAIRNKPELVRSGCCAEDGELEDTVVGAAIYGRSCTVGSAWGKNLKYAIQEMNAIFDSFFDDHEWFLSRAVNGLGDSGWDGMLGRIGKNIGRENESTQNG